MVMYMAASAPKNLVQLIQRQAVDILRVDQAVLAEGLIYHGNRQHVVAGLGQRISHLGQEAVTRLDVEGAVHWRQNHDGARLAFAERGIVIRRWSSTTGQQADQADQQQYRGSHHYGMSFCALRM